MAVSMRLRFTVKGTFIDDFCTNAGSNTGGSEKRSRSCDWKERIRYEVELLPLSRASPAITASTPGPASPASAASLEKTNAEVHWTDKCSCGDTTTAYHPGVVFQSPDKEYDSHRFLYVSRSDDGTRCTTSGATSTYSDSNGGESPEAHDTVSPDGLPKCNRSASTISLTCIENAGSYCPLQPRNLSVGCNYPSADCLSTPPLHQGRSMEIRACHLLAMSNEDLIQNLFADVELLLHVQRMRLSFATMGCFVWDVPSLIQFTRQCLIGLCFQN